VVSVDARLAGVADFNRNARPIWAGMSGRIETEWVAELKRNQWPNWAGIRNRSKRLRRDRPHASDPMSFRQSFCAEATV
jgi:hypothetical protein